MKGIVLAGGTGSRLFPLTKITNKHLLPIYDKPMIYYPIQTLVDAGIKDILLVTGGRNSGDFLRLLANGKEFGLKHIELHLSGRRRRHRRRAGAGRTLRRRRQDLRHPGRQHHGEAHRGQASRPFEKQSARRAHSAEGSARRRALRRGRDARRRASSASKKSPRSPKSNYAVTGIYMYDGTVFDKVKKLVPSGRGELEITDVNNAYIREGTMTYSFVDGWWTDAGTFESLLRATNLVAQSRTPEQRVRAAED